MLTDKQIFDGVRGVCVWALGVQDEEVTPNASLINSLFAEPRDFECIAHGLEQRFGITIRSGLHFDANQLLHQAEFLMGELTGEGVQRIKRAKHLSWVDERKVQEDASMGDVLTIQGLCLYVGRMLQQKEVEARANEELTVSTVS